jgi:hypothetical protein
MNTHFRALIKNPIPFTACRIPRLARNIVTNCFRRSLRFEIPAILDDELVLVLEVKAFAGGIESAPSLFAIVAWSSGSDCSEGGEGTTFGIASR